MQRDSDLFEIISDGDTAPRAADAVIVSDSAPQRPIPTVHHRPSRPAVRTPEPAVPEADYAYSPLIRRVTVLPWPQNFNYYQKFTQDAQRYAAVRGREASYVPYVAYTPQYANMSREQLLYYLYFREMCRAHTVVDGLDFAYVMLYIYELINLPASAPAERAEEMAWLWLTYRVRFPEIDKYLAEWLCDFCLIYALPYPASLSPILGEIVRRASLKEFWIAPAGDADGPLPPLRAEEIIAFFADYDYRASRMYERAPEDFDKMIPAALEYAASRCAIFDTLKETRPARAERDAFCGSLCAQTAKRRIRLEYISFSRARGIRDAVTQTIKLAENQLRRRLGVGARLKVENPDPAVLAALEAFFGEAMPMRRTRRAEREEVNERRYEHFYDAPSGGIDRADARRLEEASWENTAILAAEGFSDEPFVPEVPEAQPEMPAAQPPSPAPQAEGGLTADQAALLAALLDGENLRRFCAARHTDPAMAAAAINEYAMDTLGDVVLEVDGGGEWCLIDDYKEEISLWITPYQN